MYSLKNNPLTALGTASLILIACALPPALASFYTIYRTLWFKVAATEVEGIVVHVATGTPKLTVEYTAPNGLPMRTVSAGSDFYADIRVGEKLTVYYDPKRPADARIDLFIENWMPTVFALVFAVPLLLGAYGARVRGNA